MDKEEWKGFDAAKKSVAQDPKSRFLDSLGKTRTASLFVEKNVTSMEPMYTLRPFEYEGCPSLKKLYLEERDLTGYIFAEKHLYDYKHYLRLRANKALAPYFDEWEQELEILIRAESVQNLITMTNDKGNLGLQASKFIAAKGWESNGKGRPTKAQVEAETKKQAKIKDRVREARERIKLHEQS
jgi:hypothetical protein